METIDQVNEELQTLADELAVAVAEEQYLLIEQDQLEYLINQLNDPRSCGPDAE